MPLLLPLLLLPFIEKLSVHIDLTTGIVYLLYLPLPFFVSCLLLYGWAAFPGLFISLVAHFYHLFSLDSAIIFVHLYLISLTVCWLGYSYSVKRCLLSWWHILLARLFFFTVLLPVFFIVFFQMMISFAGLPVYLHPLQETPFAMRTSVDGVSVLLSGFLTTQFFYYFLRFLQRPRLLNYILLKKAKPILYSLGYQWLVIIIFTLSIWSVFYLIYIDKIYFLVGLLFYLLLVFNLYGAIKFGFLFPTIIWPVCLLLYLHVVKNFIPKESEYILFFLIALLFFTVILLLLAFYHVNQSRLSHRLKATSKIDTVFHLPNLSLLEQDIYHHDNMALCLLLTAKLQALSDVLGLETYLDYQQKFISLIEKSLFLNERIYILPNGNLIIKIVHRQFPERLEMLQKKLAIFQKDHFPYSMPIGMSYCSLKGKKGNLSILFMRLAKVAEYSLLTGKIEYYYHYHHRLWQQHYQQEVIVKNLQQGIYHDDFIVRVQTVMSRRGDDFYWIKLFIHNEKGEEEAIIDQLPFVQQHSGYSIDNWLLEYMFTFMDKHKPQLSSLRFVIPLSLETLCDGLFLQRLKNALQQYIEPYQFIFYLPLTNMHVPLSILNDRLTLLYQLGCFIMLGVMDDQSLNYQALSTLPCDFLLVSARYLDQERQSKGNIAADLVKQVIQWGQQQQKQLIAVDIDNSQLLQTIRALGIDYWQGDYVAQPKLLSSVLQ